jgi:uncharacterized protein YhaN
MDTILLAGIGTLFVLALGALYWRQRGLALQLQAKLDQSQQNLFTLTQELKETRTTLAALNEEIQPLRQYQGLARVEQEIAQRQQRAQQDQEEFVREGKGFLASAKIEARDIRQQAHRILSQAEQRAKQLIIDANNQAQGILHSARESRQTTSSTP